MTWGTWDDATMLRGLLAGGPAVRAIEHSDERRAAAATLDAVAPYRTATGGYAIENVWRFLIGTV